MFSVLFKIFVIQKYETVVYMIVLHKNVTRLFIKFNLYSIIKDWLMYSTKIITTTITKIITTIIKMQFIFSVFFQN